MQKSETVRERERERERGFENIFDNILYIDISVSESVS
jgi:hypothetical protein